MIRLPGTRRKLQQLLKKYLDRTASDNEKEFVQWYYQSFERAPDVLAEKKREEKLIIRDRIRKGMLLEQRPRVYSMKNTKGWGTVAAAAAVFIFMGVYLFLGHHKAAEMTTSYSPAIEKAILTSGDGKVTSMEGQGEFLHTALPANTGGASSKYAFINVEVPIGCKYHFKLEDGTEVWMNPASKMQIPIDYGQKNRTVRLSGEAYFSVRHMDKLPFRVLTAGLNIKDIGTEFQVKAYPEQKTTVTLAKGSILVYDSANRKNFSLEDMGQQVLVDPDSKRSSMRQVDTAFATSLKNNLFYFNHAGIDQVVLEISQWYNVEFRLKGSFKDIFFTGSIRRDSELQDVLKILKLSNLSYELEDNFITLSAGGSSRSDGL